MDIGNTIKTLRTAGGLSQKELAARLGISPSSLCLIENGDREPSLSFLKSVSRQFRIPISVLFFEGSEVPEGLSRTEASNYRKVQSLIMDVLSSAAFDKAGRSAPETEA